MKSHVIARYAGACLLALLFIAAPAAARFLSADPVTETDNGDLRHFNRYAFGFDNPYRFVDPDGRSGLDWSQRYRATLEMAGGDADLANRQIASGMATGLEAASAAVGGPGALRVGAAGWLPRLFGIADTTADAARANRIHHVFGKPDHNLHDVSSRLGGDAKAYRTIEQATVKATKDFKDGVFETTVKVAGENVTVRGAVINGETRLSTAFIRRDHLRAPD